MVRSVHDGASYTNIHTTYNIVISGILGYLRNPLVPKVQDIATFAVIGHLSAIQKCMSVLNNSAPTAKNTSREKILLSFMDHWL
jgi:hypothetical protein